MASSSSRRRLAVGAVLYLGIVLLARRKGYRMGGNVIVRCRAGHLFTTIWVPFASLKAIRLGSRRFQRCPVGRHWTLVTPVKDSDLTAAQRREALSRHDLRIP